MDEIGDFYMSLHCSSETTEIKIGRDDGVETFELDEDKQSELLGRLDSDTIWHAIDNKEETLEVLEEMEDVN